MPKVPAYSFSVEKGPGKTKVLTSRTAKSRAGWPVFSISSSSSKPHITISRANNPNLVLATVRFHSLSSKIDINLHGRPVQLKKRDHLSGGHSFNHPAAGELRWKESGFLSSGLSLVDTSGRELCRYKKRHGFDVFVQVDHAFMDMILVTGLAIARYKKLEGAGQAEAAGEAAGAVVGAVAGD